MDQNQIKKINRDPSFFEPTRFKNFLDDISTLKIHIQPKAIHQLYLKCYGYGYFQEPGKNIQQQLKDNFMAYLKEALKECVCLKILKIQFNGFSIQDNSLLKIIKQIQDLINNHHREIEILWLHTRLLRDCEIKMVNQLLGFTEFLISKKKIQEISLQISGWQFIKGPLSNQEFLKQFGDFANNMMPMAEYSLRRLKLDISSLYISDLEAYNFLKDSVPENKLIESIQNKRFDQGLNDNKKQSHLREDHLAENRQQIRKYLRFIDDKYALQHPIPGKVKYISRDPQYQKRKREYISKMLQQENSQENRKELLKVLNQERGMKQEHKEMLDRIRREVDHQMEQQAKRIKQGEELIQQTNQIERRIGQKFIKFPFDFVMSQRVSSFHKSIKSFVAELVDKLGKLQELQLDMRNWNSSFQMGELKKSLAKQFALGGVKPILHQGSKIVSHKDSKVEGDEAINLKCKFIM